MRSPETSYGASRKIKHGIIRLLAFNYVYFRLYSDREDTLRCNVEIF